MIEAKNGLFGENESLIEIVGWIDYDSEFCNNIKLIDSISNFKYCFSLGGKFDFMIDKIKDNLRQYKSNKFVV